MENELINDDKKCIHEEQLHAFEKRLARLERSWFGNGSVGAMEEIIKLRTAVRILAFIGSILTAAVTAQVVEALVKK